VGWGSGWVTARLRKQTDFILDLCAFQNQYLAGKGPGLLFVLFFFSFLFPFFYILKKGKTKRAL